MCRGIQPKYWCAWDSLQVIQAIKATTLNWQMVENIKVVLTNFRSWSLITLIEQRMPASHGFVKAAVREVTDKIWMEKIPRCIHDIVLLEQFAMKEVEVSF